MRNRTNSGTNSMRNRTKRPGQRSGCSRGSTTPLSAAAAGTEPTAWGWSRKARSAQSQSALDPRGSCADQLATLRRCNATVSSRLDGALSSSLLGEGGCPGRGEGGVVAASQRGVCLRDSLGVHASPRRLVNGARPGEGVQRGRAKGV